MEGADRTTTYTDTLPGAQLGNLGVSGSTLRRWDRPPSKVTVGGICVAASASRFGFAPAHGTQSCVRRGLNVLRHRGKLDLHRHQPAVTPQAHWDHIARFVTRHDGRHLAIPDQAYSVDRDDGIAPQ